VSADATTLVIPGHGTVFTATVNTLPPTTPLTEFTLTGEVPDGWTSLGHTSKANTIAFTKEGGEQESLGTFLQDNVRTTTASVSWGVTIPALQFDEENLALAFNGDFDPVTGGYTVTSPAPVERALFVLFRDVSASLGFWIPNTVVTLGDAPSVDTANFFELPLSVKIQSAGPSIITPVDGRSGVFQIFKTGLVAPTP
jgi:hypothetical protein